MDRFTGDDHLQIYGDRVIGSSSITSQCGSSNSEDEDDNDTSEMDLSSVISCYNQDREQQHQPHLITLVRDRDWGGALNRLETHPHEALYQDNVSRFTALHEACNIRGDCGLYEDEVASNRLGASTTSVELVLALLKVGGPSIARARSVTGEIPLCILCASDVEQEGGERNAKDGAIVNDIIRVFLQIDPKMATEECMLGWSAMGHTRRAWSIYAWSEDGKKNIKSAIHGSCSGSSSQQQHCGASGPMDLKGLLRVLFDRIDLLLHAATYGKVRPRDDHSYFRLLHAAVSETGGPMPSSFVKLAATLCADQGYERDEQTGRSPLSTIASISKFNNCKTASSLSTALSSSYDKAKDPDKFGYSTHQQCGEIIKALVSACPDTSRIADVNGRLPIQLAIENGHCWSSSAGGGGIQAMLSDAPQALSTRDMTTHLYPFMTAAASIFTAENDNDDSTKTRNLDTIYELLRQGPMMVYTRPADVSYQYCNDHDDDDGLLKEQEEILRDRVKYLQASRQLLLLENKSLKSEVNTLRRLVDGKKTA
mmetsp:Transcript_6511/g.9626  ORF Transcript_6511/g.9626 Transcript_6511/m.9626 type:complete len:539 (+) Transcript_6511:96-1712(+)